MWKGLKHRIKNESVINVKGPVKREDEAVKKENVLVCIANYRNAAALIERGMTEKKAFKSDCIVLHVYSPEEGEAMDKIEERDHIQRWADEYNATMIFRPLHKGETIAGIIGDTATQYDVNHIIIGQAVQSRWDLIVHGSLVNDLFHELDEVDVTIYKVSKSNVAKEPEYDKGISGWVYRENGSFIFSLGEPSCKCYQGTFYQLIHTDFTTGIFKVQLNGEPHILHIILGDIHPQHEEALKEAFNQMEGNVS